MANYNQTLQEAEQLQKWAQDNRVFVNTNAKDKLTEDYPAIVTVNPDLDRFIEPTGYISAIRAVRVKWVAGATKQVRKAITMGIHWAQAHGIPVLVTTQRFRRRATMEKFTTEKGRELYKHIGNYLRPTVKPNLGKKDRPKVYYCDRSGKGCSDCGNCGKLTYSTTDTPISLDLSTSGKCPHNCPDCYAKILLGFTKSKQPRYDTLKRNRKQRKQKP